MKNDKFLIKPGVLSGFHSLKEALKNKLNEETKQQQQLPVSSSSVSSFLTPIATLPNLAASSLVEQRTYVLSLIQRWTEENKENLDLPTFELEPGVDFVLTIEFDEHAILQGSIRCKCGKAIVLAKNDDKIQVSNYYKHMQSVGCSVIRDIRRATEQVKSSVQQQSAPFNANGISSQPCPSSAVASSSDKITDASTNTNGPAASSQKKSTGKRQSPPYSQPDPHTKRRRA